MTGLSVTYLIRKLRRDACVTCHVSSHPFTWAKGHCVFLHATPTPRALPLLVEPSRESHFFDAAQKFGPLMQRQSSRLSPWSGRQYVRPAGTQECRRYDGVSALDGLHMGHRCGALDPGVVLYLMVEKGMDAAAVADLLYNRSGL
jgi:hypothetical protein